MFMAVTTGTGSVEDNNGSIAKTYSDETISKYEEMGEGQRLWIELAGAPGSGKSTVGEQCRGGTNLSKGRFSQSSAVPMDGWHHNQSDLARMRMDIK
jgi:pantothenate kinase